MNRADRRKMMKTIPGYRKAINEAAKEAVDNLETMFKRNWEDDETLNNGEGDYDYDDGEDDIYND